MNARFVVDRLQSILSDLQKLEGLSRLGLREFSGDFLRHHTAERLVQLVVDAAIDINTHLLASAGKPAPADAFSSFAKLEPLGVFKREEARRLAATAGLRNRLVHRYDTIDLRLLHGAPRPLIRRYRSYCAAIRAWVEK